MRLPLLLSWIVLAVSCTSGTETGNPLTAELTVTAHSNDPAVATVGSGDGVVVATAWAALGDVTFFPEGGCDDTSMAEVALPGPTAVDLVQGAPFTAFDPLHTAYCRVEVPLHPLPAAGPPELGTDTLVVTGTLADGTPFRIATSMILRLDIRGPMDRFELSEATQRLLVAFDVATWLTGVHLSTLAPEPDGTIAVDASHNADVLVTFESNVLHSADLHHDADGNGQVDPGDETLALHH